jgi:hypothetical protein
MTTPFWINNPSILFYNEQITELWPTTNMVYEQKLNALTRLIAIITLIGYIFSSSTRILVAGVLTIGMIVVLFYTRKSKITKDMVKEGFAVQGNEVTGMFDKSIVNPVTLETIIRDDFKEGNKKNPFSNVLLTEIMDDPDRKSAPPSFNPTIDEDITKNVKRSIQSMNPGIKNTNKQLYGDLWQKFELDQSNRVFFSTANTRVANDQGAFSKFLYGNMPSAKGSSSEDNLQREKDNYRYTLY